MPILKRPRTPPANPGMVDYQNADHDQLMKRLRPGHSVEEVTLMNFCSIQPCLTYFMMPNLFLLFDFVMACDSCQCYLFV